MFARHGTMSHAQNREEFSMMINSNVSLAIISRINRSICIVGLLDIALGLLISLTVFLL